MRHLNMQSKTWLLIMVTIIVTIPTTSESEGVGKTLVVDDDLVECSEAEYTTVQSAIDAASSGDTIIVCAGIYPEDLVSGRKTETSVKS